MASDIKAYRVFIASPGGLSEERKAFKDTITEFNDSDAIERRVIFLPVGWDLTLPGIGRPQALINNDLRKSDYCILVLWDRWGTRPDHDSKYTSGTEEEFNVALECFENKDMPMRQIVVLFKSVDPRQLSDPGPELKKVLAFKNDLESKRILLFDSFDEVSTFRIKIRRHLASWVRDHESGELGKAISPRSVSVQPVQVVQSDNESSGEITDIRTITDDSQLAKGVAVGDLQALESYGEVLALTQRLPRAREVFERLAALPQTATTVSARVGSLKQLAKIAREEGSFAQSSELYERALTVLRQADSSSRDKEPNLTIEYAHLCIEVARFGDAANLIDNAMQTRIHQVPLNVLGLASAHYALASNFYQQTRNKDAHGPSSEALRLRQSVSGMSSGPLIASLIQMSLIVRSLGDLKTAESFIDTANQILDKNTKKTPLQMAGVQVALGVLRREQERFEEAEEVLRQALSTREQQFGEDHPLISSAAAELAHVLEERARYSEAENLYRRSMNSRLRRYGEDHPLTARAYNSLGRLYMKQAALREAQALFDKALPISLKHLGAATLTGIIQFNEGSLLSKTNEKRAVNLLRAALEIFMAQLGPDHRRTREARAVLEQITVYSEGGFPLNDS